MGLIPGEAAGPLAASVLATIGIAAAAISAKIPKSAPRTNQPKPLRPRLLAMTAVKIAQTNHAPQKRPSIGPPPAA